MTVLTGHCSQCHKVWMLDTKQGVCLWCGRLAMCQSQRAQALRTIKSSRRRRQRQTNHNGNGYDQLEGKWLAYYKVASKHAHKAMAQDREDLLHDIMLTLAIVERNNGHKPFTEGTMHRIASRCVAHYWFKHYKTISGLDCGHCSKAQRQKCKESWLYPECPKAIKLEYLSKPIVDDDGNITELGELIADSKAIDLDAWDDSATWAIGYPRRLVDIAYKLKAGIPFSEYDRVYLARYRKKEQKTLFE